MTEFNDNVMGENEAAFRFAEENLREGRHDVEMYGAKLPFMTLPTKGGGRAVTCLADAFKEHKPAPTRLIGTAQLQTELSFADHVDRFKMPNSALFADIDEKAIRCVYDYSPEHTSPKWGEHRAVYAFPLSDQWTTWTGHADQPMSQGEFAEFIEANLLDVIPGSTALKTALEVKEKLGLEFADQAKLLEASRGLAINVHSEHINAIALASGETQLTYAESHTTKEGGKLKVPGAFLIGVPVFEAGKPWQAVVKLRYRIHNKDGRSSITWRYDIYRLKDIERMAFTESCEAIRDKVRLPLMYGSPE